MLAVTGWGSAIVQALLPLLPAHETAQSHVSSGAPLNAERYLFCHGSLRPFALRERTAKEIAESFMDNAGHMLVACDKIFAANQSARVCIIGSESGYAWSYDGAYAASKAAVHRYVETKSLPCAGQQLICIAPSIISDAGMTTRRQDQHVLEQRRLEHPKQRFVSSAEVAQLIHYVLYVDLGYLSGTVIRLHGGGGR